MSLAIAMAMLFLFVLVGLQAAEADARASLTKYLSTPPNNWAVEGANTSGTAINKTIMELGWNMTKIAGNVGIGDGSLGAFQTVSNGEDINYTGDYIMAGDMSMAPWDPARITNLSTQQENASAGENASANTSPNNKGRLMGVNGIGKRVPGCKDISCYVPQAPEKETAVNKSDNTTGEAARDVNAGSAIGLNDPYHSMLLGRPVDDLWYEYPHAIPSNSYARLVGVRAPGGGLVNVGIRAVSYGY